MMWQRVALCVAGFGAITVSAALADETTPIANQDAPQDAFVAYLDDDPPAPQTPPIVGHRATAQAAGRAVRMLEILGVHRSRPPQPVPAPVLAATDRPPPSAGEAPPLETAAPITYQADADRSIYEANTPSDAGAFPGIAASPDSLEPKKGGALSWPINDLRDPARTSTDLLQDEGLRDGGKFEIDAVVSSGESDGSPARLLASSATPVPRILCPDGMKSSRRTIGRAAAGMNAAPAPAAEPPAVTLSAVTETPAAAAAAPANFASSPWSAPSATSLPPLPSLAL